MNINYKFCILAAGKGTRNRAIPGLHKALLPLENKAVISFIIERIPEEAEIVIAVGYKSEQIKQYLGLVWPKRKITYVDVENYEDKGSGPGLSLYSCKEHLQCPFIFTSADTITEESYFYNGLTENWMGVDNIPRAESAQYCLIDGEEKFNKFYYGNGDKAFIGIAGIFDYKEFWDSLAVKDLIKGEHQVLNGFKGLKDINLKWFTWYDTGNPIAYKKTRDRFNNEIVALKDNEGLYLENGKVIKFFSDPDVATSRVVRCQYLNGTAPNVTQLNENTYYYDYIPGKTLASVRDETILRDIIPYWYFNIGSKNGERDDQFILDCISIYKHKTYDRVKYFAETDLDNIAVVNGIATGPINDMLDRIDWDRIISLAKPTLFHGDFQPENIIVEEGGFKLIDWRQSFGSNNKYGDFYYDLGKMYHALLINGQDVKKRLYGMKIDGTYAEVWHHTRSNLLFLMDDLKKFCDEYDIDWNNVKLLGILQYLGISSLYQNFQNGEYGKFLFLYGKYLLAKHLDETIDSK